MASGPEFSLSSQIPTLRARRLLWLAFALMLPLPFIGLEVGYAPPLRMLFLGSLVLGFFMSAPDATAGLLLGLFLGQGLVWLSACYLLARLGTRLVAGTDGVERSRLTTLLALLVGMALFPIYQLPLSSGALQKNWLGLFQ